MEDMWLKDKKASLNNGFFFLGNDAFVLYGNVRSLEEDM
jgi:hypothetical protein